MVLSLPGHGRPCRPDDYPPYDRPSGQALVEFALVAPVLMLMLLGICASGMYFLAAQQQAMASSTIAAWVGAHPGDDPADYAATVSTCAVSVAYSPNLATVSLTCPTIAGTILPMFPSDVVTTATAYVP